SPVPHPDRENRTQSKVVLRSTRAISARWVHRGALRSPPNRERVPGRQGNPFPAAGSVDSQAMVGARPLTVLALAAIGCSQVRRAADGRECERAAMVATQIERRGVTDKRVLEAMRRVPRQLFVPAEHASEAYADRPLPIGHDQTISEPYIVAIMT